SSQGSDLARLVDGDVAARERDLADQVQGGAGVRPQHVLRHHVAALEVDGASVAATVTWASVSVDRRAGGQLAEPLHGDITAAARSAAPLDLHNRDVAPGTEVQLAAAGLDAVPQEPALLRLPPAPPTLSPHVPP